MKLSTLFFSAAISQNSHNSLGTKISLWILLACLLVSPAFGKSAFFLDFDGHWEPYYPIGGNQYIELQVPAFRSVANLTREDILRHIQEDFAPFDVEITLNEPPDIDQGFYASTNRKLLRVVIGGNWKDAGYPRNVAGTSTKPSESNVVWVFQLTEDGAPYSNKGIGTVASHEIAHALGFSVNRGLSHYDRAEHFNTPGLAPILGTGVNSMVLNPHPGLRTVWFKHDRVGVLDKGTGRVKLRPQDDIAVLTRVLGIRRDDHADVPWVATPLVDTTPGKVTTNETLRGQGIVELSPENYASACPAPSPDLLALPPPPWCTSEQPSLYGPFKDFFVFRSGPGDGSERSRLRIEVTPSAGTVDDAANLVASIELWFRGRKGWREVTDNAAITTNYMKAQLSYPVRYTGAGHYAVAVKSEGGYSDVGQYTVTTTGNNVQIYQSSNSRFPNWVRK